MQQQRLRGVSRSIGAWLVSACVFSSLPVPIPALALDSRALVGVLPDQDRDGIDNTRDLDDDNDGLPDALEGGRDRDGDGIPDPDSRDTDGDGRFDVFDLDSDNDGILDILEARRDREAVKQLDRHPDGVIDRDYPVGQNGLVDAIETRRDSGRLAFEVPDSDHDDVPDARDLDSDDDGIVDLIEAGGDDRDRDARIDDFSDEDGDGIDDGVRAVAFPLYDSDGDGDLDFRDLDSDGDGLADQLEGGGEGSTPTDSDGDGIPDYRDLDSDDDGLSDARERGDDGAMPMDTDADGAADFRDESDDRLDSDRDGLVDELDIDDDNDTILDREEGDLGNAEERRDSDGDGTPDSLDLDSDNDGITDLVEARFDDFLVDALDQDRDGSVDLRLPFGDNGYADEAETERDSGVPRRPLIDTDGDGMPDFLDRDSDGDKIADVVEAGGEDRDTDRIVDDFYDADGRGVDDATERNPLPIPDSDGDGIADFRDVDADNDGENDRPVPDGTDAEDTPDSMTTPEDADGDGIVDALDADDDNDGLPDSLEGEGDADGDGVPNRLDLDSDNDSVFDALENSGGNVLESGRLVDGAAVDGDGRPIPRVSVPRDSDGDGVLDAYDLDADNDGLCDLIESGALDDDGDGRLDTFEDANGDGADDRIALTTSALIDSDSDRVPDMRDLDSDNDGLPDLLETHGSAGDQDGDGRLDGFVDSDGDGLDDTLDADVLRLRDTDGDSLADHVDPDSDNDGISDIVETGQLDADGDHRLDVQRDTDRDGLPDSVDSDVQAESDSDGDGIVDSADVDQTGANDQDGDGIIDERDADTNGDGYIGPGEAHHTGLPNLSDDDADGTPDFQEMPDDSGGSGCSIVDHRSAIDPNGATGSDVTLRALLLIAAGTLLLRALGRHGLWRKRSRAGEQSRVSGDHVLSERGP